MTKDALPSWFPKSWPRYEYAHLSKVIPVKYKDRLGIPFLTRELESIIMSEWERHKTRKCNKTPKDIQQLARVGRLNFSSLKKDAATFGNWFKSYSPDRGSKKSLYGLSKKKLGRSLSSHYGTDERKLDERTKKNTRREIVRFFDALLNETSLKLNLTDAHLNRNWPDGFGHIDKLPIELACNITLKLFWAHLKLAKKRPARYRRIYNQKPPRNVFEEYVNMVCRRFLMERAELFKKQEALELQKKREAKAAELIWKGATPEMMDQALAMGCGESWDERPPD
jgi:hypothetical protein